MGKIVVLGSRGQLGSDLMQQLATLTNYQLVGLTSTEFNALDSNLAEALTKHADADYIVNCVATTNVDGCEDDSASAFLLNSSFVAKLSQFCASHDITLFHISTDYVFSGDKTVPYMESDQPNPLNIYGLSKYAGELAVQNYCKKYFILRVSSLFGTAGASGKGGNFVMTMLRLAKEKDSWTVINDQLTCPTHTLDIARAICTLIAQKIIDYGIYNCVSDGAVSWFDFAQTILEVAGYAKNKVQAVSYNDYKFKARRPKYGVMDNSKLKKYYLMPHYIVALKEFLQMYTHRL